MVSAQNKSSANRPMKRYRSILAVLPADLLLHILDRIPDPDDRKSWRLVCKDFLLAERLQRKHLTVLRRESLVPLLQSYRSLLEIDLSKCPAVDDRALHASFGRLFRSGCFGMVRSVNLSRASAVRWRGLEVLVTACPGLKKVDLSYCIGVGDREMVALAKARKLRELRIGKCLGVTDVGLARVAVGCGGLERLEMKWCLEISDIGIDLLTKKCRGLRELDLSYVKVTNASLQSISSLEKLETLCMVGCSCIDDVGLSYLNNGMNSLKRIDVSRCNKVGSMGLTSIITGHPSIMNLNAGYCLPVLASSFLSKLKFLEDRLETIKLDGVCISVSILQTIGLCCKALVEIGLSKCSGVTDEGISKLVSHCNDLRTIDLTCCHLITDSALSAISQSCGKLSCLKLESCPHITVNGFNSIGSCCTQLQEIDVTDCFIDDEGLKCLSKCSELIELKLGLCSAITDEGLSYVGSNCGSLRVLDLYRCTRIRDDGLTSIATGCKNLKKLNICYCSKISDQGLENLSLLEKLSDLEMRKLDFITDVGIAAIAKGCKNMVKLDIKQCHGVNDVGIWALAQYLENLRQINVSNCLINETALCALLGSLRCLQDAKLVHLPRVSVQGFERALRTSGGRLKKLKLLSSLRCLISPVIIQMLEGCGCHVRWIDKPLVVDATTN